MKRFRIFSWDYGLIVVVIWFMISFILGLVIGDSYSLISILISFLYLLYCSYLNQKYLTRTQVIRGYTYRK